MTSFNTKVLRDNASGVRKNAKVPEDVLKILKPNPLPVRQEDGADVVHGRWNGSAPEPDEDKSCAFCEEAENEEICEECMIRCSEEDGNDQTDKA